MSFYCLQIPRTGGGGCDMVLDVDANVLIGGNLQNEKVSKIVIYNI